MMRNQAHKLFRPCPCWVRQPMMCVVHAFDAQIAATELASERGDRAAGRRTA
jgi:hypothetical protein